FFGNYVTQNNVILRHWQQRSCCSQRGTIGGEHITLFRRVSRARLRPFGESQKRDFKFFALKKISRVLFRCGSATDADSSSIELKSAGGSEQSWNKKSLPVKIANSNEFKAEFELTLHSPTPIPRQKVDAAILQRIEANVRSQWNVFDLRGITKHGSRDSLAKINVEAPPDPRSVLFRETWESFTDAADQLIP